MPHLQQVRSRELLGRWAQRLDHIGFLVDAAEDVDRWHDYLQTHGAPVDAPPRTHRDGARSLYWRDSEGTLVQIIHHPPLSGRCR